MADSKYVKANIQALSEELALLPEVGDDDRVISTSAAVKLLLPQIVQMQRKGYRLERIVARLAEGGLSVSVSTLRGYLRHGRKKKAPAERKAPSRTPAAPPSPPPSSVSGTNAGANGSATRADTRPVASGATVAPASSRS